MPTFGVNVDDRNAEWIEEYRIRRDADGDREIVSRSQAIRECVSLARAVDETLADTDLNLPPGRSREAWLRQQIFDDLRSESASE